MELLARAAEFVLNELRVTRAVYMGKDSGLDDMVAIWAEALVGGDPSDQGTWLRAYHAASMGTPESIDEMVKKERARLRLKSLERLPRDGQRSVELLGDRVAVLIHDKGQLDEDDIFAASYLFFGKSQTPLVRKIGNRWFLAPGPLAHPEGGVALLEDNDEELTVSIFDANGRTHHVEELVVSRTTTMRVLSEGTIQAVRPAGDS